jgi:single-strand DNA-binding protein
MAKTEGQRPGVAARQNEVNTVTVVGRVSAAPEARVLPSGDELVSFRVIVPRAPGGRHEGARTQVDVIDIACWSARTRRSAKRLEADDDIRVEGALRRRFFRAGAGAASRYEVEARSVRRL